MLLLFFTRGEGTGSWNESKKIKPLVRSYVRFMESFYSPLLDAFHILVVEAHPRVSF